MTVQVRRITPTDAERLRDVRLAALADAPDSFWHTLSDESARPRAVWQTRARRNSTGDAHATFLLERGGDPVGMVDVLRPTLAPEFRELAAMWVAPALRGTGASDAFLDAAVDWARAVGAVGIRLWVVHANTAAFRLYTRHGFEPMGDPEGYSDGKVYLPMLLALDRDAANSSTFLARAQAPWTDESG
jgi:GNAT superfamily N-acetyltransferase